MKIITKLFFVSSLAKVISILAKIIIARKIPTQAMSIYSLTLPTLSLLLNICQLGIPTTISKLIAKKTYPIFKIMQNGIFILLLIDLIFGVLYIFSVPYIANLYLKNPLTLPTLYGMVLLLPLISLTSLLKGYFIGIGKIEKTNFCQISEEITRLLFIIIFIDILDNSNLSLMSFLAMFSSIIGEIASLLHLLLLIFNKSKNILKRVQKDNENNIVIIKKISTLSIMNTSTKLIGSFIYFLEPIIFTSLMIKANVDHEQITLNYGIVTSYFLPLILLPNFFSNAISMYMFPKLSSLIENKKFTEAKNIFINSSLLCLLIGFIFIMLIFLFPNFFTNILYGKEIGINYIKKYSLFFILYFLQMPFHMSLIAFDKEKKLLIESIICNILRIFCFFILIPSYKTDGMIISIIISIYVSLLIEVYEIYKSFLIVKYKN